MRSTTLSSLLFIISLCLISFAPIPSSCEKLYETICNEVPNKEDRNTCLNILKNDSKIISATNYFDLSKFILDLAIDKGIQAQGFIINITNQHPTLALKQCGTAYYDDSITNFRTSLDELTKKDFEGSTRDAQRASNGPLDCDAILKAYPNPSVSSLNRKMYVISEVAYLAINHLIHKVVEAYEINHRKLLAS